MDKQQSANIAADLYQRIKFAQDLRQEMEALALQARDLILAQSPIQLLGYTLSRLRLAMLLESSEGDGEGLYNRNCIIKTYQLALEYLHAVWSCHADLSNESQPIDIAKADELMEVISALEISTLAYCTASTGLRMNDGTGGHSADTEFHAKTSWCLIRDHRFQVLEEEFFRFVLEPHCDALNAAYGIGHEETAAGIQRISNAFREGVSNAAGGLNLAMTRVFEMAETHGEEITTVLSRLQAEEPKYSNKICDQIKDLLFGGVGNLSRHSGLPPALLDDLSYAPGESTQFFAAG